MTLSLTPSPLPPLPPAPPPSLGAGVDPAAIAAQIDPASIAAQMAPGYPAVEVANRLFGTLDGAMAAAAIIAGRAAMRRGSASPLRLSWWVIVDRGGSFLAAD